MPKYALVIAWLSSLEDVLPRKENESWHDLCLRMEKYLEDIGTGEREAHKDLEYGIFCGDTEDECFRKAFFDNWIALDSKSVLLEDIGTGEKEDF